MANKPFVDAREMEGLQHCHGDDCDEYYFRPLVYGDNLFTYIAHIPPGGGVPSSQEEADMFELSLYILDGHPQVIYGDETFSMYPHTALHCKKGVPLGFENPNEEPVSLIISFTPSPQGDSNPDELRRRVESHGRSMLSAQTMNQMAGNLLNDAVI